MTIRDKKQSLQKRMQATLATQWSEPFFVTVSHCRCTMRKKIYNIFERDNQKKIEGNKERAS